MQVGGREHAHGQEYYEEVKGSTYKITVGGGTTGGGKNGNRFDTTTQTTISALPVHSHRLSLYLICLDDTWFDTFEEFRPWLSYVDTRQRPTDDRRCHADEIHHFSMAGATVRYPMAARGQVLHRDQRVGVVWADPLNSHSPYCCYQHCIITSQ